MQIEKSFLNFFLRFWNLHKFGIIWKKDDPQRWFVHGIIEPQMWFVSEIIDSKKQGHLNA